MLEKTFEWLRVAYPNDPSSEIVVFRKATVGRLLTKLIESADEDVVANFAVAAILGISGRFKNDSSTVKMLVDEIRADQAAFPANTEENAIELQVIAALVVGELLSQNKAAQVELRDLVSVMVVLLLESRPLPEGQHLASMLSELQGIAAKAIDKSASRARRRRAISVDAIDSEDVPADLASMWKAFQQTISEVISQAEREAAKDREELELLWCIFNGFSETLGTPFSELPTEVAAIASGRELAGIAILPPSSAVVAMVVDAATRQRKAAQLADSSLEQILPKWKGDASRCLVPTSDALDFVKSHPALFPLSWIALRLREIGGTPKWTDEFGTHTSIDGKLPLSKVQLARQAFFEHCCLRMALAFMTEDDDE